MVTTAEEKYGPAGGNPESRTESDQAVDWTVKLKEEEAETKSDHRTPAARETVKLSLEDTFLEQGRPNLSEIVRK